MIIIETFERGCTSRCQGLALRAFRGGLNADASRRLLSLRRDQLQRRQPHAVPYQRCYCSICRKSAGGGGYAINIMGLADTLKVRGNSALGVWNAPIDGHKGSAERHYCKHCGTPLWVSDEQWPELVHPFASAIDTELPKAPLSVHLLLRDKASWVEPQIGPNDHCFDGYPELSIEDWHKKHELWIE